MTDRLITWALLCVIGLMITVLVYRIKEDR